MPHSAFSFRVSDPTYLSHRKGKYSSRQAGDRLNVTKGRNGEEECQNCLLVAPLHAAVALEEVDGVAEGICKDLDLNVARPSDVTLQQHTLIPKRRRRLALGGAQCFLCKNQWSKTLWTAKTKLSQESPRGYKIT